MLKQTLLKATTAGAAELTRFFNGEFEISNKEGVNNRSFCNFQSSEDPSKPTLTTISANLPTITVSVPDASASEPGSDTATFTLDRGSATNGTLTVNYTFSGTATPGSDYTESGSGSVTFAAGASTANVVITAVNDAVAERLETVILTVTPDAAYNIGSSGTGTATITDDNDDNNDVLVRYIFTDANSTASTFSLAPQVYSTNVSATVLGPVGITLGNSGTTVSAPNAGYINSTVTTSNQTGAIANDDYFAFTLTPTVPATAAVAFAATTPLPVADSAPASLTARLTRAVPFFVSYLTLATRTVPGVGGDGGGFVEPPPDGVVGVVIGE